MSDIFDRFEAEKNFPADSWQKILFSDFSATLTSEEKPFPCIFGVAGYNANQLRFFFTETLNAAKIAPILADYLAKAKSFGANTSLVILTKPGKILPLTTYQTLFWNFLRDLSALDQKPWPANIPENLDEPLWEFSFAGEPIFVVCNTPAHVLRQSRHFSCLMVTFQPRWVFDSILGSDEAAKLAFDKVRKRLRVYDFIEQSPALGRYGKPETREFSQYFLDEDNQPATCPFHTLKAREGDKNG